MEQIHSKAWSENEFKKKLMDLSPLYHIHHPYQKLMNTGQLNPTQIRAWVANRFYYQIKIPQKDAAIIANCPVREVRREWLQRIIDHDGRDGEEGGIEAWLHLGEACGLNRDDILSEQYVLPGVRFAVDAYVHFARESVWYEGICACLTELFATEIHRERLKTWPEHYLWINQEGLNYFRNRLQQAPRDVEHALTVVMQYFVTPEQQLRALHILKFKLNVLWSLLDALYLAYIVNIPPLGMKLEDI